MLCSRYVIEDAEVHVQYQDFRSRRTGSPPAEKTRQPRRWYENSLGGTMSGEANDYDYDLVNAVNSRNATSIAGCPT